ncbi:hypothetical protein GOP47_0019686 [Adiantum capillus-veneris]|uniref:Uncharacterized protein n=1 Tax=Adiantum capillus-veneris TaxID=13818 RepID=A0A9D4Z9V2_ADICA|nr:hypothetical protein GOP47_0019686 [Adiantum capillus-veneris]
MQLTLHSSCHGEVEKVWPSLRGPGLLAQTQQALLLPTKKRKPFSCPRAYIEKSDAVYDFFNKFKEFCTRVFRNFSLETTRAFYDFEDRHGSAARPQYVLLWCWAAALGAGLLKSEDMMKGANRLRATFDIFYEEEILNLLMDEAMKKRQKSKSAVPFVPYEARAEKALEAICKCCIGKQDIDEEDAELLICMLQGIFPAGDKAEIERSVRCKVRPVEDELSESSDEEKDTDADIDETNSAVSPLAGERLELLNEQQGMLNTLPREEKSSTHV